MNKNKVSTFEHKPVIGEPLQRLAFSGRGFVPDLISEHALASMPEASRSQSEQGFVPGKEGMLPPPGIRQFATSGSLEDEGASGGAGSFATVTSHQAKG